MSFFCRMEASVNISQNREWCYSVQLCLYDFLPVDLSVTGKGT